MKIQKFLSQSAIFALYQAASDVVESYQARLAEGGVHLLQGLILTALLFEEREARPSELARVFAVEPSTLSHALRGLERKGWLRRALHPRDSRGYLLALTPSGKRKAQSLVKEFDDVEARLEAGLGARRVREAVEGIQALRLNYLAAGFEPEGPD